MKSKKRISKRILALIVAGGFIAALLITLLGFFIAFWMCDANAQVWTPSYEKMSDADLKALYESAETDEEFQILFEQTGLTKIGIERARAMTSGWTRIKQIHDSYFAPREVKNGYFCPLICTDYIEDYSTEIYLEKGDILITSSTHFAGFRIGHSGIVAAPESLKLPIWQSSQIGAQNGYSSVKESFTSRINFMVVRIKPQAFGADHVTDKTYIEAIDDVVEYITTDLKDAKYSPFTGVFTKKNACNYTSCSHLLWYGFLHFDDKNGGERNIDLDPNGGLLVVPKDISRSPYVELVQTFGFDPEKMYE